MPQIPKHRKVRKASVLIKRGQCLRNHSKSYKPLYDKLKNNNNSLARALSKEKQECQLLFSQNVALVAEVHNLGLACSKRDKIISNVLHNAKEMLAMLITVTGYVTNTISTCQEFVSTTNTNFNKQSVKRLSTKSPAKGVVKPMVSGHTITKPTINLSRVNMQNINNPSGLSTIEEISITPNRSQEVDNVRSPVAVSIGQLRYENGRTCRMPERITVASPPGSNEEDERRLSNRTSRHSQRKSARYSRPKSDRLSRSHIRKHNFDCTEHVGSPRVKLNDVSKLLQNSQTINVRTLVGDQNDVINESSENSDAAIQESSEMNIIIPETQASISYTEEERDTSKEQMEDEPNNKKSSANFETLDNNKKIKKNPSDWEDPLEGPSWMFSNSMSCLENGEFETDDINDNISSSNCSTPSTIVKLTRLNVTHDDSNNVQETLPKLNKSENRPQSFSERSLSRQKSSSMISDSEYNTTFNDRTEDDDLYASITSTSPDAATHVYKTEDDGALNLAHFVTHRRGSECKVTAEDPDDFTLMFMRNGQQNMQFDINDLQLPVLEGPVINPTVINEPEPEITTTIQRITTNCPIPTLSDINADESTFNQTMVKLPLILNNSEYNRDSMSMKSKIDLQQCKKRAKISLTDVTNHIDYSPLFKENCKPKKKTKSNNKDPSAVIVVLQKLNDSHVKPRTPSPQEEYSRESSRSLRHSPVSSTLGNSSDSESSVASNSSTYTAGTRPRRRKAPVNLKEPSLQKKLRRKK